MMDGPSSTMRDSSATASGSKTTRRCCADVAATDMSAAAIVTAPSAEMRSTTAEVAPSSTHVASSAVATASTVTATSAMSSCENWRDCESTHRHEEQELLDRCPEHGMPHYCSSASSMTVPASLL